LARLTGLKGLLTQCFLSASACKNLQPAPKGKSATFLRIRRQICLAGVSMGLVIQIKWNAGLGFSPCWYEMIGDMLKTSCL